jgi:Tol biopolymer transport system component
MKTKMINTISTRVFAILALILYGATITFAQLPPLRANGKIAFTSNRDGNQEIYVMNNDGTGQVRLTNNPGSDSFPAFSPDGRKIAFISQNPSPTFAVNIKLMNADGTNQIELTPITYSSSQFPWFDFKSLSWSPDGSKIAFDDGGEIFTINVNGSNRTNLTSHPANDFEPAFSPDGSRILFISTRAPNWIMHTMNADGSDVRALPSDGYFQDFSPDWSPTGDKIVFLRDHDDFGKGLFTANADGTNRQVFDECNQVGSCPDKPKWSPDGTKIVFHKGNALNDTEIFVKNVNGSGLTQLTNTNGRNFQPSWQRLPARTPFDFDNDGRANLSIFRPSNGTWFVLRENFGLMIRQFGLSTDKITPADYDGDGRTDFAVFRDGAWYWLNTSNGAFNSYQFGQAGDVPVPFDYTGDGRAELAVYRSGFWYTLNLANNQFQAVQFGISTDKLVPADFDGDGRADYAVYRDGIWYLLQTTAGFTGISFGISSDLPAPADYDGDGKADIGVYRDGTWYLQRTQAGFTEIGFGSAGDKPLPNAFVP